MAYIIRGSRRRNETGGAAMIDLVKLQCPGCAGKLEVAKDLDQFACAYCGMQVMVRRGGGTISLSPVVDGLKRVERGVDRTASELAIKRLEGELAYFQSRLAGHSAYKTWFWIIFGFACLIAILGCAWAVSGAVHLGLVFVSLGAGGAVCIWLKIKSMSEMVPHWQAAVDRAARELQHHRENVRL